MGKEVEQVELIVGWVGDGLCIAGGFSLYPNRASRGGEARWDLPQPAAPGRRRMAVGRRAKPSYAHGERGGWRLVGKHRPAKGAALGGGRSGKRTDVQVVPGVVRAGAFKAQRHLSCCATAVV